jgi:hypothetical protein
MESGKVFISSVLNLAIEDFREERKAIREVIEEFPFLRAWAFEGAPASPEDLDQSYLRHVDECDLFILIIGSRATGPVNVESLRAKRASKSILVFAKHVPQRSSEAEMVLEALDRKYAPFDSIDSLKVAARSAICDALVLALRTFSSTKAIFSIEEQLRKLAEHHTRVRVSTIIPVQASQDDFYVQKVESGNVFLEKGTNMQTVGVPVSRVSEILPQNGNDPAVLSVLGRIQLTTQGSVWKFFSETPPPDSLLGIGKLSHPEDAHIQEIRHRLGTIGFRESCWDWDFNLSQRLTYGWEIFYDDDGRYLRWVAQPSEQIFIVKR